MDLIAALRTQVWQLLTQDEQLQQVCGATVRLYNTWADKDSPMPYLVHRMQEKPLPDGVITHIDYYLDLWDYNPSMARVLDARQRLLSMLDGEVLTIPSGEFVAARFRYVNGADIPEDTKNIQHYATQWQIRVDRTADIKAKE